MRASFVDLRRHLRHRRRRRPRPIGIAGDVDDDREVDGHGGGLDGLDLLANAVVAQLEVRGGEAGEGLVVPHRTDTSTMTTSVAVRKVCCGGDCCPSSQATATTTKTASGPRWRVTV